MATSISYRYDPGMPSTKGFRKLRVFVASPGDVDAERASLPKIIARLNRGPAHEARVTLELVEWGHAAPGMGRPENVILQQLPVASWDIFLGILWLRFGQPTGNTDAQTGRQFESGTEEEFTLAYRAWRERGRPRIMFYHCTRPPTDLSRFDQAQYEKVVAFFQQFGAQGGEHPGLFRQYRESEEFATLVYDDLAGLLGSGRRTATNRAGGSSAAQVGLMAARHETRTPEQLERPTLDALHTLRFAGVRCRVDDNWQGEFRLQAVPAPILRAWLRVGPAELSGAVDRLRMLEYIDSRPGGITLPFAKCTSNPRAGVRSTITRELIIEKPDASHLCILHIADGRTETVIAIAGMHIGNRFEISDPCPALFDVRPAGQVVCHSLTATGLRRYEDLHARL